MGKEDVACIYSGILVIKKGNIAICHNKDGPRNIVLSEVSQRKTNVRRYYLCMKSKKKKQTTNELICKTETDSPT